MTIFVMPFVAAVVTVMLYLAFKQLPALPLLLISNNKVAYALINGAVITTCFWLIVSLFCSLFATAQRADIRSYGGLRDHISELEADLSIKEDMWGETEPNDEEVKRTMEVALKEAIKDCDGVVKLLSQHRSGISWVLGTDYINAWDMYRRAAEKVFVIMPRAKLIGEMRRDQLAIKNASINNREDLLDDLQQALAVLDPASTTYFRECQFHKNCQTVEELRQTVDRHKEALKKLSEAFRQINPPVDVKINVDDNSSTKNEADVNTEATARNMARQVRRTLNEYRADLWAKLLGTRNQLLVTIALAGIVTYTLLFTSIVVLNHPSLNDPPSVANDATIWAAVAFYIVGALSGLAGRFHKELGSSIDLVGDHHLSLVRLIAVPLLSGLAGIGGVLLTTMLTAWGANDGSPDLSTIFSVRPGSLVIAAVFGLTPNLLIQGLQKRAEKYASDLEKSEAEGPKTSVTNI